MKNKLEELAKPKYWRDLSEEEKRAIRDPRDYPLISVIKAIPQDTLNKLDKSLESLSSDKSFFTEELPWLRDFFWYKNENKSHNGDLSWDKMCIEYRLYFAAKHPDRIKNSFNFRVKRFLKWIDAGKEYYKPQLD